MSLALVETSAPERTLDQLAAVANEEHFGAEQAISTALGHALRAGDALNQVYARLSRGEWLPWLAQNFTGTPTCAHAYRRLALHAAAIEARSFETIAQAEKFLRDSGLGAARQPSATGVAVRMRELRKGGLSCSEIAELYGVSTQTVSNHTFPGAHAKKRAAERRATALRRAGLKALREQQRDKQVRAAGGPIAEAYALTRRLAALLDAAISDEHDADVKSSLNSALKSVYNAEDKIVAASRAKT